MPGDPKECRTHALRCIELAEAAKTPELKKTLSDLARQWTQLAVQLEAASALLEMIEPKPGKTA